MGRKVEIIGGRIYGLRNLHVVVMQQCGDMVVLSRHRSMENARKRAEQLANRAGLAVHAALSLIGNPLHDYTPGDILDPGDIVWPRVNGRCSECCDNYIPDSLEYRCPGTRGKPLCETVAAARILPGESPK